MHVHEREGGREREGERKREREIEREREGGSLTKLTVMLRNRL